MDGLRLAYSRESCQVSWDLLWPIDEARSITMSLRNNGILVGVSECFLFRGQVQTGLNSSQKTTLMIGRADIRLGTILATVALAFFHFRNIFTLQFTLTFGTLVGHF